MFGSRQRCCILPTAYSCLVPPSCFDAREQGRVKMTNGRHHGLSTLEEETLREDYRYESDNHAKQIAPRKRDLMRKGAEEVFIKMFETLLQEVPDSNTTSKSAFEFV